MSTEKELTIIHLMVYITKQSSQQYISAFQNGKLYVAITYRCETHRTPAEEHQPAVHQLQYDGQLSGIVENSTENRVGEMVESICGDSESQKINIGSRAYRTNSKLTTETSGTDK